MGGIVDVEQAVFAIIVAVEPAVEGEIAVVVVGGGWGSRRNYSLLVTDSPRIAGKRRGGSGCRDGPAFPGIGSR
jgi:hypothetical protein